MWGKCLKYSLSLPFVQLSYTLFGLLGLSFDSHDYSSSYLLPLHLSFTPLWPLCHKTIHLSTEQFTARNSLEWKDVEAVDLSSLSFSLPIFLSSRALFSLDSLSFSGLRGVKLTHTQIPVAWLKVKL